MSKVTPHIAKDLLSKVQYVLLDIDGVVWSGNHVYPNIPETIAWLRSQGKQVRFLSNNASVSRAQLSAKFKTNGITGVAPEEVYNSGYAASLHLKSLTGCTTPEGLFDRNVFVIGEEGLHMEIRQVLAPGRITYGLELQDAEAIGGYSGPVVASAWKERVLPPPLMKGGNGIPEEGSVSLSDLQIGAVVVGLDMHFNMMKLSYASLCLQKKDENSKPCAVFVATNEDPQIPIGEDGYLLPGAGGMVSALQTVSGRTADAVCGKPFVNMAKLLFDRESIDSPQSCLMVGDRLTTDIKFGNDAGCKTMLVLTGAEGEDDVRAAENGGDKSLLPMYIADSLASLYSE